MYLCIDLKSFFASVEAVERGLDPMTENLIVADSRRGEGAICLAITPAMKKLGIKNRCRVFEIPKDVDYVVAIPRMKLYMEYSAKIYSIYLKYVSPEDIHVYSIDECFIDITNYLKIYSLTAKEFAKMLISAVFNETGISATCGIGTNLFLAKVALDVSAKNVPDKMGFLDETEFKRTIWHHRPITDIWNIGRGIANRLAEMGIYDLYGVAHASEERLYKEFGINAELLIDHAKGIEPCTISDIHAYSSKSTSLSNVQIVFEDYSTDDAFLIIKEMLDVLTLELIDKHLVTNCIALSIGYSDKLIPSSSGMMTLGEYTNSYKKLLGYFKDYFYKIVNKKAMIRKINLGLNNLVSEDHVVLDLFTDVVAEKRERAVRETIVNIKKKYGKNSILKAMDFQEKATARQRNTMIGGHNGGEDE
ncbi:MAG: DNA repair protein [Clostridia bacterium]|nr:DNA repair protein [Clostridia bacterium]